MRALVKCRNYPCHIKTDSLPTEIFVIKLSHFILTIGPSQSIGVSSSVQIY